MKLALTLLAVFGFLNASALANNQSVGLIAATQIPSFENQINEYLQESGAALMNRSFETSFEGPRGQARRIINVSAETFPVFERLFVNQNIFYLFHEPFQRVIQGGYNGWRGPMGRFEIPFNFTYSGAMVIPIVLSDAEAERLQGYLQLANAVPRYQDVASFPWLLRNSGNATYMPVGNENSLSEWFARMPIGSQVDDARVLSDYSVSQYSSEVQSLIRRVWTSPHAHQSLRQVLNLQPFKTDRDLDTPGLIASSILANASLERVPVVFRYVDDHTIPMAEDFNNWFDIDFNPNNQSTYNKAK